MNPLDDNQREDTHCNPATAITSDMNKPNFDLIIINRPIKLVHHSSEGGKNE